MYTINNDNKRYYSLNSFYRNKFKTKVVKIPLDAGLMCPNKSTGGCIYCSNNSMANIINNKLNVIEQFYAEQEVYQKKWPDAKYIAYFQTGTNTFANLDTLKELFEPFLNIDNCVGLSIATRPDAITDECIEYLANLNTKTFLTIELGLQSSNDHTLKLINRGHNLETYTNMVKKLHEHNIFVVAHIINGFPNETEKEMLDTIKYLNEIKIDGIKIHMLCILKGTILEKYYLNKQFKLLTKDEYVNIVCKELSYLNENVVVERLTADPIKEDLIEPKWVNNKKDVLNSIQKEMVKKDIYQGICYNKVGE